MADRINHSILFCIPHNRITDVQQKGSGDPVKVLVANMGLLLSGIDLH